PYSPATKVGNLIFVSGQAPAIGTNTIEEQTLSTLKNIKKILEATGAKISNIVKISIFLKNIKDFDKMNQIYRNFFENSGVTQKKFPARTTVEVSNLPINGMLIEIDAIAAI
ncbi:MAG: RidA family protein, partial [Promethearchaeota archaeon]